ncbi:hypothetical protein B0T20DRAFT_365250 [Sordaria brevicollis]|uniref:C2 domain-containing protein n=1 Tax=Sordaria brevicollis TaxID=83679 RepID=A0AAE0U2G9_SORBR|nr:hypothetical protein B0T20DRAFT_365250 [Sordaria brevicollis]
MPTKVHESFVIPNGTLYADTTTDGPPIGTLVLVVDRAKNLPNLKTIGKQDPYCTARLGKESKKTTTDIRGGQTPRWDQELRFTVCDSPDYYQVKISVFNDDKKNELIGEAWIDIQDLLAQQGGQIDEWHQLQSRGKYAGEVRVELTYYDHRPKPEKAPAKQRQQHAVEQHIPSAVVPGPGPRGVPKRRPLPAPSADGPYIPNQSPLQQLEYNNPHAARYQQQPQQQQWNAPPQYQQPGQYDLPSLDEGPRGFEGDRPPPPPAHRSRNGSAPTANGYQNGYDQSGNGMPLNMRQDVLRNEAHRQTNSIAYPGRPQYRGYDSAPAAPTGQHYSNGDQPAPPRHSSTFDVNHDPYDLPDVLVPGSANSSMRGRNGYGQPNGDQYRRPDPNGYGMAYGRHSESSLSHYPQQADQRSQYQGGYEDHTESYQPPPVPVSLVPGIDPSIAQEITERVYQDKNPRRYTQPIDTQVGNNYQQQPRDRSPVPPYQPPVQQYPHSRSPGGYQDVPPPTTPNHNMAMNQRSYSPNPPVRRDPSPMPSRSPDPRQHTIKRKSVSPAPPPVEERRLSGVPFGPDSYDALNPTVSSDNIGRADYNEASGKIITHDGKEVDPSDHLPMESWAPEPEPKKTTPPSSSHGSRPSMSGAHPMPGHQGTVRSRPGTSAGGERPRSMHGTPQRISPPVSPSVAGTVSSRNRLQKRNHRNTITAAGPMGMSQPGYNRSSDTVSYSSSSQQDNFTPRALSRASTFDYYGAENGNVSPGGAGGPVYGGHSPGAITPRGGGVPPVPAKVPLALPPPPTTGPMTGSDGLTMTGALQLHSSSLTRRGTAPMGGVDEWGGMNGGAVGGGGGGYGSMGGSISGGGGGGGGGSLEEELSKIDIGTGRSRRFTVKGPSGGRFRGFN